MAVRIAAPDVFMRLTEWKLPGWLRARVARLRVDPSVGPLYVLSPPEQAVLRELLATGTRTLRASAVTAVALSLEHAGIIAIYREAPQAGVGFQLRLNSWALEHLRRHPRLLGE